MEVMAAQHCEYTSLNYVVKSGEGDKFVLRVFYHNKKWEKN